MNLILYAAALGSMLAASSPLPETYSYIADSSAMGSPMIVKVNRNGSREVIEQTMMGAPGAAPRYHARLLYDFQAHRIYTLDLNSNICTAQRYESPYAPQLFDTIGAAAEMAQGGPMPPALRNETVNGIAARLVEVPLPEGQGKYRLWMEQKFNFPVKWVAAFVGKPETTMVEMRQLSYAPSPAGLFTPPAGCQQVGGTSDANGGHAEMSVEASAQATHDLGSPAPQAEPAAPPRPGKVTAVRLRLVPERYTGACPAPLQLVGEITTDGPGTVWYSFLSGAVAAKGPREGTMQVAAAGTHRVTLEAVIRDTPRVGTSLLAIMQEPDGSRGVQNVSSGSIPFNITCTR